MIELQHGAIYESTSGLVKYDGVDRFHGEQTFRFKRLDRIGTDYVLPSEIEKFLCIEKTREELAEINDELVAMNKELLAALEGVMSIVDESNGVSGYHMNGDIADWGEFEEVGLAYDAIAKAKGTS